MSKVIICWMNQPQPVDVYALAYHGGSGMVRSYERDRYDGRLEPGLPYFDRDTEALAWMANNPRKQCQVKVGPASIKLGFRMCDVDLGGE